MNAALINTLFFYSLDTQLKQVEGWQRNKSTHTHTAEEGMGGKWGKEERPCTCSTGLRLPDSDLAGRGGGQSWLEPDISSWYHCSKSSLGRWGLLPSHWYCRAHRGAAKRGEGGEEKRRQEEIRKHSKTDLFYTPSKAVIKVFFILWKLFLNIFNTLLFPAALCFIPSGCYIPVLHVSILILCCGCSDPVSHKNISSYFMF